MGPGVPHDHRKGRPVILLAVAGFIILFTLWIVLPRDGE